MTIREKRSIFKNIFDQTVNQKIQWKKEEGDMFVLEIKNKKQQKSKRKGYIIISPVLDYKLRLLPLLMADGKYKFYLQILDAADKQILTFEHHKIFAKLYAHLTDDVPQETELALARLISNFSPQKS